MSSKRLRFGSFVAPFHPLDGHPGLAMERDLEMVEWMDKLGFDEAWIGEHHSGGWEINASPELFIAAASQRTRNIRFGTGVSSTPYHHPFILADRIRQLDYLTRGRLMFGIGPGSLPSDAYMMGISTPQVRDIMDASVEPLVRLLNGETVTMKTDWFTLQEARLQLNSYTEGGVEIAVANQTSPTGSRAAGKHGLSLLSIGATSAGGFNSLASNWAICEDMAREHGKTVQRSNWRLVGPVHIAETREQARADCAYGFERWLDYFANVAALPMSAPKGVDPIDFMISTGFAVIGTPDDCVAQIERLQEQSGGFGCFLTMVLPWADFAKSKKSFELMANYVIPTVNKLNANRKASETWLREHNVRFRGEMQAAVGARIAQHAAEKGTEKLSPHAIDAFTKN